MIKLFKIMNDKSLRLLDLLRILDRQGKNELNKDDFISRLKVKLNFLFILNPIRLTFDLNLKKNRFLSHVLHKRKLLTLVPKYRLKKLLTLSKINSKVY